MQFEADPSSLLNKRQAVQQQAYCHRDLGQNLEMNLVQVPGTGKVT